MEEANSPFDYHLYNLLLPPSLAKSVYEKLRPSFEADPSPFSELARMIRTMGEINSVRRMFDLNNYGDAGWISKTK